MSTVAVNYNTLFIMQIKIKYTVNCVMTTFAGVFSSYSFCLCAPGRWAWRGRRTAASGSPSREDESTTSPSSSLGSPALTRPPGTTIFGNSHGLINCKDTKAKCRHLNKLTWKGTLRQVFIRFYTFRHYGIFDLALWTVSPLTFSLVHLSSPLPPSLCE